MNKPRDTRDASYAVGYGKPPREHRFRKGQSGNPRGRPPQSGSLPPSLDEIRRSQEMIKTELYREVVVREGDRVERLPLLQAIVRSMGQQAVRGNRFSQRRLLDLMLAAENEAFATQVEFYKCLFKNGWLSERSKCDSPCFVRNMEDTDGLDPFHPRQS